MSCFGLLCSLFFLITTGGEPQSPIEKRVPLVEILSEPQENMIHSIFLDLDSEGNLVNLVRKSASGDYLLPFQDLIDGEVVLAQAGGHDAVILSCPECTVEEGGELEFRYLYNGANGTYRQSSFDLAPTSDAWAFYTSDDEQVKNLTLKSRKILGRLVGIDRILVNSWKLFYERGF